MGTLLPTKVFLVRGQGRHKEKLVSFEKALREAGIAPFNLVRVSSIYPPRCLFVTKAAGLKLLKPGQILFVVLSENATDEPGRLITASIGMAVPDDPSRYGYLAEHSDIGKSAKEISLHTEYLAAEMLATKLGEKLKEPRPGGPAASFRISNGLSLKTRSVTQSARGEAGMWTTTVAAAVLIC
ncbi:MAG: arginine decarboxylase, pyruvoyl-dependent [Candidatus Aminicenantes bacterium]|nr:MAG: arginine decarboxylase, pyruvoyl-dependent [Candidatus Aminicenantes bacterium]